MMYVIDVLRGSKNERITSLGHDRLPTYGIGADLSALEFSRRAYKLARLASGSPSLARRLAPYPLSKVLLERDFELFFPVFSHTYELYSLATIPNWRQRCRKAACYITEVWSDMLPGYLLELLSAFDHVFLGSRHSVQDVARITGLIKTVAANRTVLMVEHNLSVVESLSHTITVLARGEVLAEGDYAAVSRNPDVIQAYMGTAA